MPQEPQQKIVNKFNKGLLTEFSELGFPEDASIDELNCDLLKAGNRTRRLGVEFETGYEFTAETYSKTGTAQIVGMWKNVGENPTLEYIVVQVGAELIFYENADITSGAAVPVSNSDSSVYKINLGNFAVAGSGVTLQNTIVETTYIKGVLIVVGEGIEAFYVQRNSSTGAFTETVISFKERDFEWLTSPIDDLFTISSASPANTRIYDTYNAGWTNVQGGTTPLATYQASYPNQYPPLVLPWYAGKNSSGAFTVAEWQATGAGTSLQANGHYILGVFNKDRSTASGLSGLPTSSTTKRFTTVASYASRVFYAGYGSKVYFTRTLTDRLEFGLLYSLNDPTAEDFNDLLDTDGGYIDIPDAVNVKKLHVFGASILVFADNGVWRISGVDNVFRATEYSVYRISDTGIAAKTSFISTDNAVPFWWSYAGIQTLQVTDEGGMVEVNVSRPTIQTFWDNIFNGAKENVKSAYDKLNSRIVWMYPTSNSPVKNKVNDLLFLDVELGAFFPWTVADTASDTPFIIDAFFVEGVFPDTLTFDVVAGVDTVIDVSLNNVVADITFDRQFSTNLKYLVMNHLGQLTFATFSSESFLDWGSANYSSYAESAYDFFGDLARRKTAPYITVMCRSTETALESLGNGYVFDRPSSLLVSNYWDFKRIPSVSQQQAYRIKRPVVVDSDDLSYDSEYTVNTSRIKLRGKGRVLRLRFESEEGKDFNLLGWEVLGARNPRY